MIYQIGVPTVARHLDLLPHFLVVLDDERRLAQVLHVALTTARHHGRGALPGGGRAGAGVERGVRRGERSCTLSGGPEGWVHAGRLMTASHSAMHTSLDGYLISIGTQCVSGVPHAERLTLVQRTWYMAKSGLPARLWSLPMRVT
jgi:hypothetical protein